MANEYHPIDDAAPPRSRVWLRWLILFVLVFAAGAASMGYMLTHWPVASRYIAGAATGGTTGASALPQAPARLVTAPQPAPTIERFDAGREALVERRIADLEGRIGRIGARANAAAGNADRAEGLLVAFAARRALDRGVALGYIEALLRDRFGESQPQAVATIIAAGRQPVTLEELQGGLSDIGPALAGGGPNETWLDGVRRELAGLVVVRRGNVPSPDPADRLARAKRQLEAGHVATALAEVARMPGRDAAAGWIAAARRYAAARDALDMIETAALLEPRGQPAIAQAPTPIEPAPSEPAAPPQESIGGQP